MMNNGRDSLKMKKTTTSVVFASVLSAIVFNFAAIEAVAAQPHNEEFHSTGNAADAARRAQIKRATTVPENPMGRAGANAIMSNTDDPAVRWFEEFDKTVVLNSKTSSERAILNRPLNQESERVQEWSTVAGRVSQKYKYLALVLRNVQVPPTCADLKEYAKLTADWFADSAAIYDDLLKPRRAAKTIEELEAGLNAIEQRAKAQKVMQTTLIGMDRDLRSKYHVHVRKEDDALQQYILGNPTKEEIKSVGGKLPR